MFKTLYEICLKELIINFEKVEDLQYVPFDPFIIDILNYIIETNTINDSNGRPLGKTILRKIGESHGQHLRKKEYLHFGSFLFQCRTPSTVSTELSYFIQSGAPQLITRLDLSMAPLYDEDLVHFKLLANLVVLDLTNTLISDTGISHLARFTQPNDSSSSRTAFLQHLKILSVAYCQFITDRSLRYIPRMKRSLVGIDLSTTLITPTIASTFLLEHGYQRMSNLKPNHNYNNKKDSTTTTTTTSSSFYFRNRSTSSDTIICPIHEQFKREYCPQHSSSLITYCDNRLSEEYGSKTKLLNDEIFNPAYRIQQNGVLNSIMNGCILLNPYISVMSNPKDWKGWWKHNDNDQKKGLVFILKPSTKEISSNKKRSLEMEKDNNNNVKVERPIKIKNRLQVKQSMDATTFLQNFQL